MVCGSDWDSLGELLPDWGYEVYADSLEGGFRHFLLRAISAPRSMQEDSCVIYFKKRLTQIIIEKTCKNPKSKKDCCLKISK